MIQSPRAENSLLIINAGSSPLLHTESGDKATCIRCINGRIKEIAAALTPQKNETVLDAQLGAVVPGLHDHHLHLFAAATAKESVDCTDLTEQQLVAALRKSSETKNAVRAVNYHESIAGPLNRDRLDSWVAHRELRIQHSTGQMWFLNSRAIADANLESDAHITSGEVERNPDGSPNGRIFRGDHLLKNKTGERTLPNLKGLSQELASYGITGVTDTSHNNGDQEFEWLQAKQRSGELLQHLRVMGNGALRKKVRSNEHSPGIHTGELKLLLDEAALPDLDNLINTVQAAHQQDRSVAFHCVTRIELAFVLAVFTATGVRQDRIEHASVLPVETLTQVKELGLTTVTQPGLIYSRGDRYLAELNAQELAELYRLQSLNRPGMGLSLSSDAPYGPLNPWLNMQCSVDRKTSGGQAISASEALTPEQALSAYCGQPQAPATPRVIAPGATADLVVLAAPWSEARHNLAATQAYATLRDGQIIYQ